MNSDIILKIIDNIAVPIIALLVAAGIVYFLYGVAMFFKDADSVEGRQTGSRHMIWGIVGIVIMVSVFGIISFIKNSVAKSIGTPTNLESIETLKNSLGK